ncbi:MAG: hypothetical protein ABSD57_03450 [Verrucomicrobiota bacterium]|jgi:hypothetical protein
MKTALAIFSICVAFFGQTQAQTNQTLPTTNALQPKTQAKAAAAIDFRPNPPFDSNCVTTVSGKVYEKIQVSKVEPDGVVVSYTPKEGGMAITKISFEELPDDWRDHYGYSPQKAEEFRKQKFNAQVNQSRQWIVDEQNLKALKAQQAKEEAEQAVKEAQRRKEILDLEIRIRTLEAQERTALASERMAAAQESQAYNQSLNQGASNLESARIANELADLNSQLRMLRYGN